MEPKLHWAIYLDTYFQLSLLYLICCEFLHPFIVHTFHFGDFFHTSQMYIGVAILLRIIYLIIRYSSIEMAVTNYRVVYKIGLINIYTEELSNEKLESVSVRQTIMGRLLNYGDIIFSGTGTSRLVFKKVYAPWWIKSKAEDIIRESYMRTHTPSFSTALHSRDYY
ncbi:MAG: PH domain-containing protein [Alphaproteobacteria bacterium]|nr:PH domain-containing protein [Alphaproteobacteria bacterium]